MRLRRVLTAAVGPEFGSAAVLQPLFTAIGVITFLAGALYLPTLAPTRVEMIVCLLLLAILALLCATFGQLVAVGERLNRPGRPTAPPSVP